MAAIGLKSEAVAKLAKESLTEAGVLKDTLFEMTTRVQRLGGGEAAGGAVERLEKEPRVLSIAKSGLGVRRRTFPTLVDSMCDSAWPDWPLSGPRTVLFVLSYISEH